MVKRMIKGAIIGFIVGKIFVILTPQKIIFQNLFGVNENFFMTISIILISIFLFSISPSFNKGSK